MKIGYVSLNVSDMSRSIQFYQSVLGFRLMGSPSDEKALLSADEGSRLIELSQASGKEEKVPDIPKRAGLYHFAILLPERKFLADMLQHLGEKRDQVHFEGMADHLVSESIYIRDPDLNGIEIYRDRPSSEWEWDGSNNHVRMATERLDTQDLLKEMTEPGWKGMPARTAIGHVHLHVRDLANATKFYSEILGLNLTGEFPGAHFFAADGYHHHVAANTWLGKNIAVASPERIGLNHFGIELPSMHEFEETAGRLAQHKASAKQPEQGSKSAFFQDGDGITVRLYCN